MFLNNRGEFHYNRTINNQTHTICKRMLANLSISLSSPSPSRLLHKITSKKGLYQLCIGTAPVYLESMNCKKLLDNGDTALTVDISIFFANNAIQMIFDVVNQNFIIDHELILDDFCIFEHCHSIASKKQHVIM